MRVGLFTDTYFPQVSGVATSIRTLKTELEKLGHRSLSLRQRIKMSTAMKIGRSFRIPSVPFFAFKDRRVAYRGSQRRLPLPSNTSWILSIPRLSFHWAFGSVDWTRVADSSYSYLPYPV